MRNLAERLRQHFEKSPPNLGDAESAIDLLYWHYTEYNPINSRKVKDQFAVMRSALGSLSSQDFDRVFGIVSDLCMECEKLAFVEGLQLGFVLMQELENS